MGERGPITVFRRTEFGSLTWANLANSIARHISDVDQKEVYEARVNEIHNVLLVISYLVWEEHAKEHGINSFHEIKDEMIRLKTILETKKMLYTLLSQGAKQAMYPEFKRGRKVAKQQEPDQTKTQT